LWRHIQGTLDDEYWYELFIDAEQVSTLRSDGTDFSLDQFQSLGNAYWENFARRQ
jgi:hypothetical protein